ncbi:hypothetical protein [Embleya sp. AB8]|uniref:hypothetical protein n=1 Tax=Embleya sp. AB8 TaxID=3156304 RepID=UPI003C731B9E
MSRCVKPADRRAATPAVPDADTRAPLPVSAAREFGAPSPRARLTRRLFIDLRRSAGSLCH